MIQSLEFLLRHIDPNLAWIAKILAILVCLGVIGEIASWVTSPSKALHVAAEKDYFLNILQRKHTRCSCSFDDRKWDRCNNLGSRLTLSGGE